MLNCKDLKDAILSSADTIVENHHALRMFKIVNNNDEPIGSLIWFPGHHMPLAWVVVMHTKTLWRRAKELVGRGV